MRGHHHKGDTTEGAEVKIATMDGTNKEEIDVFAQKMSELTNLKVRKDNRDGLE